MSELIFIQDGVQYGMGFQPTPYPERMMFAAASFPTLAESEWIEINRRQIFHDLGWYPDQINTSGCTGFSSAMAGAKARVIAGQPPHKLSGAYLYSLINGGRDQGSNIGAALTAFKKYGCARDEICDVHKNRNFIYRKNSSQFDTDAARFKIEDGQAVNGTDQAVAVIQRGGILEFAVCVGNNFGRIDDEGVALRMDGGYANHAVHADGLIKTSRGWCVDLQTWTRSFADKSRIKWPVEWLEKTKGQEMWAVFGVIDDPNDTHDPPSPS